MGDKSKCSLLFLLMSCTLLITVGLMCNVYTIAVIPSSISEQLQHTLAVEIVKPMVEPIVEEFKLKFPKWEMPALLRVGSFWIFILDLVIILSAKFPKMTWLPKRWYDVAFLASYTVSF